MDDWRKLPQLRDDPLLFWDASKRPKPGGIVPCMLCTKPMIMPVYSGNIDQICVECAKTYHELPVIVCMNCASIIGRVVPKKLDNGFEIKRGQLLHTDQCGVCNPGLEKSTILEIAFWEKNIRDPRVILGPAKKL